MKNVRPGLTSDELFRTYTRARSVLAKLVQAQGIFADDDNTPTELGRRHLTRQAAVTALLILEAEKIAGTQSLSAEALHGLLAVGTFQAKKADPANGAEIGKIPAEVDTNVQRVAERIAAQHRSGEWSWRPEADGSLRLWDAADVTPLWLATVCRYAHDGWILPGTARAQVAAATRWCLNTLEQYGGFIGWTPPVQQAGRRSGGLRNQGWKDSDGAYAGALGTLPAYPLYEPLANAAAWSGLLYAADYLRHSHPRVAHDAERASRALRRRFNKGNVSFWLPSSQLYAEALDAQLDPLRMPSIDMGMVLGVHHEAQTIVPKWRQYGIVHHLLHQDFLEPHRGLRTYPVTLTDYLAEDQRHRGPGTFWPFAQALTGVGLAATHHGKAAQIILSALVEGLSHFDTFVDMYQVGKNAAPTNRAARHGQAATQDKAWTAAAAYYATSYLLHRG